MRDDMVFAVVISYYDRSDDDSFICRKLSDVDEYIADILNHNNDRSLKSIVIDVVDFYEPKGGRR